MSDIFDFNRDGKTSFEEELLGTMLVIGTLDGQAQKNDGDFDEDDCDDGDY